jgi:hypothetical protein
MFAMRRLGYWVQILTRIAATASIGVPETAICQQNADGRYAMRTIHDSFRRPLRWREIHVYSLGHTPEGFGGAALLSAF